MSETAHYFNYFLHQSKTPAIGFRYAQQPRTGLWNVYATMQMENKKPLEPGEEPEPEPAECKPNEALVARALRSLATAKLCVANAEVCTTFGPFKLDKNGTLQHGQEERDAAAAEIWHEFETVVMREKSGGRYETRLPNDAIVERGRMIFLNSLRVDTLERFGCVAIPRREIYSFELLELDQTITIYLRMKADIKVCVPCATFTVAQHEEALRVFAEFTRHANSQVGDHTIDFDDLEPLPINLRRKERHEHLTHLDITATDQAKASSNIENVTLNDVAQMAQARETEEDDEMDDKAVDEAVKEATIGAPVAGDAGIKKNGNGKVKVVIGKKNSGSAAEKYLGEKPMMVTMKKTAQKK